MKIFAGWRSSLIALGTDPIEVDHYLEPLEEQQGGIEREPDWSTIEDRGEVSPKRTAYRGDTVEAAASDKAH